MSHSAEATPLAVVDRRRAMRLVNWNGAIHAMGAGFSGITLITYLGMQFDVAGMGLWLGLILATPSVAGLLRLLAPPLIDRLVDRKRFCLATYLCSAVMLAGLPWVALSRRLPSAAFAMATLVALWCVYQVLAYLGDVALWSWLADLAPLRVRGRFFGRRERWMSAGQAVGMAAGGFLLLHWKRTWPYSLEIGYAATTSAGAAMMLVALAPLARIPRAFVSRAAREGTPLSALLTPLADRRFLWLLLFGCWWSFSNGIIDSLQNAVYPYRVLGLEVFVLLWLRTGVRLSQMAVGPWVGRLIDRWGNRPVMIGGVLLVAQAPLFFFMASREQPWWIVGAWVMWIAWIGLSIGEPNLTLKLARGRSSASYIALWFTVTGLCFAASTVVGGALLDHYRDTMFLWLGHFHLDCYRTAFLLGWMARCSAALLLLLVVEPGRFTRSCRP
jgi:MFS family permease